MAYEMRLEFMYSMHELTHVTAVLHKVKTPSCWP